MYCALIPVDNFACKTCENIFMLEPLIRIKFTVLDTRSCLISKDTYAQGLKQINAKHIIAWAL